MPTIKRLKRNTVPSERKRERQKLYNDTQYRKLRDWYFQCNPLCEDCLKNDKIVPACDVHHKISPFQGSLTWEQKYHLLRDVDNFISLCRDCHNKRHNNIKRT